LAAWGKLDEKTQKAMIEQYGEDGVEKELIGALKELTMAIRGETEGVSSKESSGNPKTSIKDKDGNVKGHASVRPVDNVTKSLDDTADNFEKKVTDATRYNVTESTKAVNFANAAEKERAMKALDNELIKGNINLSN
jgi:hypothetical protein